MCVDMLRFFQLTFIPSSPTLSIQFFRKIYFFYSHSKYISVELSINKYSITVLEQDH